jgi:hypothetical protein
MILILECTSPNCLVLILGTVVLRRDNQPPSLLRSSIHRLNDINHLLFILQCPVDLVIIPRPQINHHMFIAEEEHHRTGIVKLVHFVEIRDFVYIDEIEDGKVLAFVGDAVEDFVLFFAGVVPVAAEADDDNAVIF